MSQHDALKKSFWSQIYRQNPLRENAKVMAQYEGRLILSLSICTTGSHKCELDGFSIRTKGARQHFKVIPPKQPTLRPAGGYCSIFQISDCSIIPSCKASCPSPPGLYIVPIPSAWPKVMRTIFRVNRRIL